MHNYSSKKLQLEKDWTKERNRIKRLLSRAEKRGFSFPDNLLPTKPKKVTEKSVERLRKINPATIYKKATYTVPETGETVSGNKGRALERSKAASKGAATRKKGGATRKKGSSKGGKSGGFNRDDWYDGAGVTKAGPDDKPASIDYNIIEKVRQAIDTWSPSALWSEDMKQWKRADKNMLQRILDGAIQSDGYNTVAKRLQDSAVDINTLVDNILYKTSGGSRNQFDTGRERVNADLVTFSSIVKGRALSIDESIGLTEAIESLEVNN